MNGNVHHSILPTIISQKDFLQGENNMDWSMKFQNLPPIRSSVLANCEEQSMNEEKLELDHRL
jgi:hypothetical protein